MLNNTYEVKVLLDDGCVLTFECKSFKHCLNRLSYLGLEGVTSCTINLIEVDDVK